MKRFQTSGFDVLQYYNRFHKLANPLVWDGHSIDCARLNRMAEINSGVSFGITGTGEVYSIEVCKKIANKVVRSTKLGMQIRKMGNSKKSEVIETNLAVDLTGLINYELYSAIVTSAEDRGAAWQEIARSVINGEVLPLLMEKPRALIPKDICYIALQWLLLQEDMAYCEEQLKRYSSGKLGSINALLIAAINQGKDFKQALAAVATNFKTCCSWLSLTVKFKHRDAGVADVYPLISHAYQFGRDLVEDTGYGSELLIELGKRYVDYKLHGSSVDNQDIDWTVEVPKRYHKMCLATVQCIVNTSGLSCDILSTILARNVMVMLYLEEKIDITEKEANSFAYASSVTNTFYRKIFRTYATANLGAVDCSLREVERQQSEITSQKETIKKLTLSDTKSTEILKQQKDTNKSLISELNSIKELVKKLEADLRDKSSSISDRDYTKLKEKNKELESSLARVLAENSKAVAQVNSMNKTSAEEMSQLKATIDGLVSERDALSAKLNRAQSTVISIPTSCLLVAMSGMKICIVGGDIVHSQFEKYQKLFKTIKSDEKSFDTALIENVDLVVFMTNYLSHTVYNKVSGACSSYGTKIMHESSQNFDIVCSDIFYCVMENKAGID